MKQLIVFATAFFLLTNISTAQGCIIVRNISGFGQYNFTDHAFSNSEWFVNITSRYFKSFRDFKGSTELKYLKDSFQTVRSFSTDITTIHLMANGWSVGLSIPVSVNSRDSKIEHGGVDNPRHTTHSFGLGDIRFTAYKWILKPAAKQKINVQLGLGIKFPTGDYKYQDYFYRKEDSAVLAPVNPSIQLGDGGTGIITELNTFYIITKNINLYGNFYYLVNPRDQNGTSNLLGKLPTTPSLINQVKSTGSVNSVPDQYTMRAGANFQYQKWLVSAGLRTEGIPVYDLIGQNNGARRAGHNTSIEPGLVYTTNKFSAYAYVPVIIEREIKQNVPDKRESAMSGKTVFKQGGSGNYFVFVGVQFKL